MRRYFQYNYFVKVTFVAVLVVMSVTARGVAQERPDYETYGGVLSRFVDAGGMVDYEGLKRNRSALDAFVESLATVSRDEYAAWGAETKIAFWINAYNAITLKVIIDNYPIKSSFFLSLRFPDNSIRQIGGAWDEITHIVMGEEMTLNHIEHQILRENFNEPRIHLALVCAAMGCPPLRNEPYTGSRLGEQLHNQGRHFYNNPEKFRIDKDEKKVLLSSIFKWYGEDFTETFPPSERFIHYGEPESSVIAHIAPFLATEIRNMLEDDSFSVRYLYYDWSLNEQ